MSDEHYLKKIERNAYVLDKAPEEIRSECLQHIMWARELSSRLDSLDYDVRQDAITKIHSVLDEDYKRMGFGKEDESEKHL